MALPKSATTAPRAQTLNLYIYILYICKTYKKKKLPENKNRFPKTKNNSNNNKRRRRRTKKTWSIYYEQLGIVSRSVNLTTSWRERERKRGEKEIYMRSMSMHNGTLVKQTVKRNDDRYAWMNDGGHI